MQSLAVTFWTPRVFDVLEKTPLGAGGELQLTDGIKGLLQHEKVYGYSFEGLRFDAGDKLGNAEGNGGVCPEPHRVGWGFSRILKNAVAVGPVLLRVNP